MGGNADKQHANSTKKPKGFQKGNPHRFKPGQSGNPKGRPTDHAQLRALIQELAGEEVNVKGVKLTRLEAMLLQMFRSRSPADRQNILEHGYGRVPQAINLTLDEQLIQLGINPADAEGDLAAAITGASQGTDSAGDDAGETEADRRNPG